MLVSLFGEQGEGLWRIARKLGARYNIDVEDVAQELAIAADQVRDKFGFVHVNTTVNRAKDALLSSSNYGVNRYYTQKGVAEVSDEAFERDGDSLFADNFSWRQVDVAIDVRAVLEGLPELDRKIATGLSRGWTTKEIGQYAGCHPTTVSIKKADLRRAFAVVG